MAIKDISIITFPDNNEACITGLVHDGGDVLLTWVGPQGEDGSHRTVGGRMELIMPRMPYGRSVTLTDHSDLSSYELLIPPYVSGITAGGLESDYRYVIVPGGACRVRPDMYYDLDEAFALERYELRMWLDGNESDSLSLTPDAYHADSLGERLYECRPLYVQGPGSAYGVWHAVYLDGMPVSLSRTDGRVPSHPSGMYVDVVLPPSPVVVRPGRVLSARIGLIPLRGLSLPSDIIWKMEGQSVLMPFAPEVELSDYFSHQATHLPVYTSGNAHISLHSGDVLLGSAVVPYLSAPRNRCSLPRVVQTRMVGGKLDFRLRIESGGDDMSYYRVRMGVGRTAWPAFGGEMWYSEITGGQYIQLSEDDVTVIPVDLLYITSEVYLSMTFTVAPDGRLVDGSLAVGGRYEEGRLLVTAEHRVPAEPGRYRYQVSYRVNGGRTVLGGTYASPQEAADAYGDLALSLSLGDNTVTAGIVTYLPMNPGGMDVRARTVGGGWADIPVHVSSDPITVEPSLRAVRTDRGTLVGFRGRLSVGGVPVRSAVMAVSVRFPSGVQQHVARLDIVEGSGHYPISYVGTVIPEGCALVCGFVTAGGGIGFRSFPLDPPLLAI